jgi:hypothetical protein
MHFLMLIFLVWADKYYNIFKNNPVATHGQLLRIKHDGWLENSSNSSDKKTEHATVSKSLDKRTWVTVQTELHFQNEHSDFPQTVLNTMNPSWVASNQCCRLKLHWTDDNGSTNTIIKEHKAVQEFRSQQNTSYFSWAEQTVVDLTIVGCCCSELNTTHDYKTRTTVQTRKLNMLQFKISGQENLCDS